MFGYVRPFKPQLRVYEWELYNGLYCGLCKNLTAEYGYLCAAALSYDMVFLALVAAALESPDGSSLHPEKLTCPAHPLKRRLCVHDSGDALSYAAAVQVILAFHKLRDDLIDAGALRKLRAAAALPLMLLPYRKAAKSRPRLAESVKRAMKQQRRAERSRTRSVDRAAEPTAAMTSAVFRELGGCDPDLRRLLGDFGYMLGRYIYLCDALDDLPDDIRRGSYNPLAAGKTSYPQAKAKARASVYLTLGRLGELYSQLPLGSMKAITDNIVYLGLRRTFDCIGKPTADARKEHCRDCATFER